MQFLKSNSFNLNLLPGQEKHLSSKEKIQKSLNDSNVLAFDVYDEKNLIGFVMLQQFDIGSYFLWNFAIDIHFQNQNYGTRTMQELISILHTKYSMHTMTTTYKLGNEPARKLYEKVGFIQMDIVDEEDCQEVNMIYHC